MNQFAPQRLENETRAEYAERRANNKRHVQSITLTGKFSASGGTNLRKQRRANQDMSKRIRFADMLCNHWTKQRVNSDAFQARLKSA